jgi:vacuolar-type H+-ATPase subunit B/Vma2
MTGLEQFLHRAKTSGSDKGPHWEVGLTDGTSERGEIIDVLSDSVVLRQLKKRSSANTRHEAVQVMEDVVHCLVMFTSIRLVRVFGGG